MPKRLFGYDVIDRIGEGAGALERSQALAALMEAGHALSAVHYLLYVHADFKPNNILVQADGKIRLIDFGQACRSGTIKERVQGTPDFIAPEQVKLEPVTI